MDLSTLTTEQINLYSAAEGVKALVLNDDNSGCLSIRDNGRRFNPLEYKYSESQYGIRIIRGITDRIDYHYIASMNCLNMYIK